MVNILVVEDEEDIRNLLVEQLEELGYKVRKADNGAVGLQRVSEQMPDIIFVDVKMPVMDGFVFVTELREDSGGDGNRHRHTGGRNQGSGPGGLSPTAQALAGRGP